MVVPEPQVQEAALVPGMEVLGVRSLKQVVALLRGDPVPDADEVDGWRWVPVEQVAREVRENPDAFTPWFRIALSHPGWADRPRMLQDAPR